MFPREIRSCLDLWSTPMADAMTVFISKWRYEKLAVVVGVPQTTQNLALSRSCFAEDGKELYRDL